MQVPYFATAGTPAGADLPEQAPGQGHSTLVQAPAAGGAGAAPASRGDPATVAATADAADVTTFRLVRIVKRTPLPVWILVVLYVLTLTCWSFLVPVFSAVNEPAAVDGVMRIQQDQGWPSAPSNLLPQTGAAVDRTVYGTSLRPAPDNPVPPAAPLRAQRPSWNELAESGAASGGPQPLTDAPPLFYGVGSAVLTLIPGSDSWAWDQSVAVLRLVSVLLAAPLPLLAWAAARRLTGSVLAGVTAAVIPFAVPELSHVSSTVTSDALLILLGGLAAAGVAFVLRGDRTLGTAVRLGVISGLAALTGLPGLVLAPWVLAAYLIVWYRVRREQRAALLASGAAGTSAPDGGAAAPRGPLQYIGSGMAAGARGVSRAAHWLFAQPEPKQSKDAAGEHDDDVADEPLYAVAEEDWEEAYAAGAYPEEHEAQSWRAPDGEPESRGGEAHGEEAHGEEAHQAGGFPADADRTRYIDLDATHQAEPHRFERDDEELDYWHAEDQDSSTAGQDEPFDESGTPVAGDLPEERDAAGQPREEQSEAAQAAAPGEVSPAAARPARLRLWRRREGAVSGPGATSRRLRWPGRPRRFWTLVLVVLVLAVGCGGFWWIQQVINNGSLRRGILTDQGDLAGGTWEQLRSITGVIGERWWAAIGWAEVTFTKPVVIAAAVVLAGVLAFAVVRARGRGMRCDLLFMLVPTVVLFVAVGIRAFAVGGDIHAFGGPSGRLLFVGMTGLAVVAGAAALGLPRRFRGWAPLTVLAVAGGLQAEAVRLTLNHFWGFADDPTAALRAAAGWSAWPGSVLAAVALVTGLVALVAVVALVRVEEQEDAQPAAAAAREAPAPAPRKAPAPALAVVAATAMMGPKPAEPAPAAMDMPTVALPAAPDVPAGSSERPSVPPPGEWEPYPPHRVTLPSEPTGVQRPQETHDSVPPGPDIRTPPRPADAPPGEPAPDRPRRRLSLRKRSTRGKGARGD